jgi:hypothetical protein
VDIRNPHSFLNFEVTGKDGVKTKWGGEWAGAAQLSQFTNRELLKFGDKVTVDGAPPRDPSEHKLLVQKVVRPADAKEGGRKELLWQGTFQ